MQFVFVIINEKHTQIVVIAHRSLSTSALVHFDVVAPVKLAVKLKTLWKQVFLFRARVHIISHVFIAVYWNHIKTKSTSLKN